MKQYMFDLGRALQHLHQDGLAHRDVKSANVMCTKEHRLILIDFGSVGRGVRHTQEVCTLPTRSVELMDREILLLKRQDQLEERRRTRNKTLPLIPKPPPLADSTKVDVWSFGILL